MLQYGTTCYIMSSLSSVQTSSPLNPSTSCNVLCSGFSTDTCGGSCATAVYNVTTKPYLTNRPYVFDGSYWDCGGVQQGGNRRSLQARALPVNPVYTSAHMTVELCVAMCAQLGQTIAGLQNAYQCFCGTDYASAIAWGQTNITNRPSVPCPGNANENCGASWYVVQFPHFFRVSKTNHHPCDAV